MAKRTNIQLQAQAIIELRKRQQSNQIITYEEFRKKYFNDWAGFAKDCIIWKGNEFLSDYQEEILTEIPIRKRAAIRGPHGIGKSFIAAISLLAFVLTRDIDFDWKVPTTASAWRQVKNYLWPEIHKWSRRLDWSKIGREPFNKELLTLNMRLKTGEAFALVSDNHELIEGAHASQIYYLFDESKAIPDETFDAAEGAFSTAGGDTEGEAFALAISTPGEPMGRFYDIHQRKPGYEDWWTRHVTLEEAVKAKRVSNDWAEQRKRQWGEDSALYQNRVLGEFHAGSEYSVIPLSYVEHANENWYKWQEEKPKTAKLFALGVDIGTGGENDKTVIAENYERYKVDKINRYPKKNVETLSTELAGRIEAMLNGAVTVLKNSDEYKEIETEEERQEFLKLHYPRTVIDTIGIGLGTYNILKERKLERIMSFVAGGKAERQFGKRRMAITDKSEEYTFADKRSAMWWLARELLNPKEGFEIALPPDDLLTGELTAPTHSVLSGARIKVESKDDIRKRLKRSTDTADAVLQALVGYELCEEIKGVFFA